MDESWRIGMPQMTGRNPRYEFYDADQEKMPE
jgi:hypothetical protein